MAKGLQARLASQGSFLSDDESDDEAMRGHGAATNDESGGWGGRMRPAARRANGSSR